MRVYFFILLLTNCLFSISTAQASHLIGGELAYEYVGTATVPHRYHVVARLFCDANNTLPTTNGFADLTLTCSPTGCVNGTGSFLTTLNRVSSPQMATGCNGGGIPYYLVTLDGIVNLPPAQWKLSFELSTRPAYLMNVQQPTNTPLYVSAELNNSSGLVDSSPRFTTTRVVQFTSAQSQHYSAGAFDPDGDSLAYRLIQPLGASTAPLTCGSPTAGSLAPHFSLNTTTGELSGLLTNGQLGVFAQAVRVTEYRRLNGTWQAIGSVMRDLAYFSSSGPNLVPAFTSVALTASPNTQLMGQPIPIVAGQTVSLTLTAADADAGQTLTLNSDAVGNVPGLTFQNQGNGQGQLTWQVPASLPTGHYTLTATVFDNACPVPGHSVITLPFVTMQPLSTHIRQLLAQLPYPTPFQETVQLQLASPGPQHVTITDGLGRVVAQLLTTGDGRLTWRPAPALAAGLYFARTTDGSQVARLAYAGR